jgi:hypothetical protein
MAHDYCVIKTQHKLSIKLNKEDLGLISLSPKYAQLKKDLVKVVKNREKPRFCSV